MELIRRISSEIATLTKERNLFAYDCRCSAICGAGGEAYVYAVRAAHLTRTILVLASALRMLLDALGEIRRAA
jgi:hypothetical protein